MRTLLLVGLAALSFSAGGAFAATRLSDAQMDHISAGALPSCIGASMCSGIGMFASSTTVTTTNSQGVTTTTTTNTTTTTPLGGSTGSSAGSTGGNSGSTGGNSGSTGLSEPADSFPLNITLPQFIPFPINLPAG